MATLTETRIEIADRHTTLSFLRDPPTKGALGDWDYTGLYRSVCNDIEAEPSLISESIASPVLKRLFPICNNSNRRFWREYLDGVEFVPELAMREGLPLLATINPSLTINLPVGYPAKVSPKVAVFLYPFGWSTWLSLRVTKDHTLQHISQLLAHLFQGNAFILSTQPSETSLDALFDFVSARLRLQVFAGSETRDRSARDQIVMTTVVSKFGGSPSLAALSSEDERRMMALVTPNGPPLARQLSEHIFHLGYRKEVNYLIFNKLARFIWLEELLVPEQRNRQHLNCYHNNSFLSLLQSWHLEGVLSAALNLTDASEDLLDIIQTARERLSSPRRKNASLIAFLQSTDVTKILARWNEKSHD